MKELIDRLQKAVDKLVNASDAQPAVSDASADPKEETVNFEQFVGYVAEQFEKASQDTKEVQKQRLQHLSEQISKVSKNFEGPTPQPGAMAITRFQDPDQQQPESSSGKMDTTQSQATNYSSNPQPPGVRNAGNQPSGGEMPPQPAGTSGFASPDQATFAKAMQKMTDALNALTKPEQKPEGNEEVTKSEDPEKKQEEVKKTSTHIVWPQDMNSEFGLGDKTELDEPEWGFDAGSEMDQIAKAQKAKKDQDPKSTESNPE